MSHMAEVWIDDFDKGLIKTLGSVIHMFDVDEGQRGHWAIDFSQFPVRTDANGNVTYKDFGVRGPAQFGEKVPVYFVVGQPAFTPKIFPAIVIRRVGMDPAPENGSQAYSMMAKRAAGSAEVTVTLPDGTELTGYDAHEVKPAAFPYNITYEISIRARGDSAQQQGNLMWRALSRVVEPRGFAVKVEDSEGDERGYDGIVESVTPNIEVLDLTGRGAGWTLTVIVHGELDHIEPYGVPTLVAVPTINLTTN